MPPTEGPQIRKNRNTATDASSNPTGVKSSSKRAHAFPIGGLLAKNFQSALAQLFGVALTILRKLDDDLRNRHGHGDFSILRVNGTAITDTGERFKVPGHPASARMSPQ